MEEPREPQLEACQVYIDETSLVCNDRPLLPSPALYLANPVASSPTWKPRSFQIHAENVFIVQIILVPQEEEEKSALMYPKKFLRRKQSLPRQLVILECPRIKSFATQTTTTLDDFQTM